MRIILVRGQNFASGGQNFASWVKFLLVGVKILLVWDQIRNLKKMNIFSKKLFLKFNFFSTFFFKFLLYLVSEFDLNFIPRNVFRRV